MTASAHQVISMVTSNPSLAVHNKMLVTMRIDHQLFGIDVECVRDVLKDCRIAPIPKAPPEILGSINLRGRIVNVIDLRKRLRLSPAPTGKKMMFVVVESGNEFYSLVVDSVSEVLTIPSTQIERTPPNLPEQWSSISAGVCRLQNDLLVVADIQALLKL